MAPPAAKKTAKRAASSPGKAQQSKVPKTQVDPTMAAVIEAIELASVQPASCKEMLLASLPCTLGVTSDRRSLHMAQSVDMLREIFEQTQQQLQSAVDEEEANLSAVLNSKDQLSHNVAVAEGVVAETLQAAETEKNASQEAESLSRKALAAKKSAQDALKANEEEANQNETALRDIQGVLNRLTSTNEEYTDAAKSEHRDTLLRVCRTLPDSSETFLLSVASSVEKAPAQRGPFDLVVIEQLQKSFTGRAAQHTVLQETYIAKRSELAAMADSACAEFDRTQDAEVAAGNVLLAATARHTQATEALKAAKDAEAGFAAALAKATCVRDEKVKKLKRFGDHNMLCFSMLVNKVSDSGTQMEGSMHPESSTEVAPL